MDFQAFPFHICFIFRAVLSAQVPADWKSRINPAVREEIEARFTSERSLATDDIIWDNADASRPNMQADHAGRMVANSYWLEMRQCIPFKIDSSFDREKQRLIKTAFHTISTRTSLCLAFKEQTTEQEYISILPAEEAYVCEVAVGFLPGRISIIHLGSGCFEEGIIIHEVLHALGFYHEQNRPDRDQYVTIHESNIHPPWMRSNFERLPNMSVHGVEYDLNSILHYNHLAFASGKDYPTILPKVGSPFVDMGQRRRLSALDVVKLQRAYGCIDEDYRLLPPKMPNRCEKGSVTEKPSTIPSRRTTTSTRPRGASSVDVRLLLESMEEGQANGIVLNICESYRGTVPRVTIVIHVTAIAGYTFNYNQLLDIAGNQNDKELINCAPASFELHITEIRSGVSECFHVDSKRDWTNMETPRPGRITVYRHDTPADKKTVDYSLADITSESL